MTKPSLIVCPVWSEALLCTWRNLGSLTSLRAQRSAQRRLWHPCRLIWVFIWFCHAAAQICCNWFLGIEEAHKFQIYPREIQQCLVRFGKGTCLLFFVTTPSAGDRVRHDLGIQPYTDPTAPVPEIYFDPTSHGNEMSQLMKLWHFSSSVNSFFKPSGARCLIFRLTLRLLPYFMCANSEGSGETAGMRRLPWAFVGRLCDKYHNLISWLIYLKRIMNQ